MYDHEMDETMKRTLSLLLFALLLPLFFTACALGPVVNGSGEIITEEREVGPFTGVDISGGVDVDVTYGGSQSVELTSDHNIVAIIETTVRDGVLFVRSDESYSPSEGVQLEITVPVIELIDVSGSSDVTVHGVPLEANRLDLFRVDISGSADVATDWMEANRMEIEVSGSGSLMMNKLDIDATAIDISGSGDVVLTGAGEKLDAEVSGSGNVIADRFEVEEADVEVRGSGDMRLHATDILRATISGSGEVLYRGRPKVDADVSGSGEVRAL